jgi:hypothetical protein
MSDEFPTTQEQFKCACVDQDPTTCYYLRYNIHPLELTQYNVCECPCHDGFDPLDEDEQDRDERLADYEMMQEMQKADHELEMQRQRDEIEAIEKSRDEMIKRNNLEYGDSDGNE